jgi:hypothetical protein
VALQFADVSFPIDLPFLLFRRESGSSGRKVDEENAGCSRINGHKMPVFCVNPKIFYAQAGANSGGTGPD